MSSLAKDLSPSRAVFLAVAHVETSAILAHHMFSRRIEAEEVTVKWFEQA